MAREASITQEQINAAADAIRATGTKPTARAVRDAVGGGSMATVLKYLQVWQSGQVKPAAQDVTLPPTLTRALVDFIGQEVAQAKAGLEADLAVAQQAAADLISESERQAAGIEAQEKALEEAFGDKAELAGKLGQIEVDLGTARDEAGRERLAAEAARTELAKAQLRLEALPRIEAETDRLRVALEASEKARQEAERQAAVLMARLEAADAVKTDHIKQIAAAEGRADKAEAKAEKAEQLAQAKTSELTTANTMIQAANALLEAAERELTAARKSAEEARALAKKAGEEAAELKGELNATKAAQAGKK